VEVMIKRKTIAFEELQEDKEFFWPIMSESPLSAA